MRQFLANGMPDNHGRLPITGKDFKYLVQVLRLKKGDIIHVRLPDSSLVLMEVDVLQKKTIVLSLLSTESLSDIKSDVETGVSASEIQKKSTGTEYWLFQFLTKLQKMDIIVRQATEIGVSTIVPVLSEFSYDSTVDVRTERWERIVREARQQSGSPYDTKILSVQSLASALQLWNKLCSDKSKAAFMLYEKKSSSNSLHGSISQVPEVASIVVGCEGGISDSEAKMLEENDFIPIHFETNILRAETASIYGLAAIRTVISEYNKWCVKE